MRAKFILKDEHGLYQPWAGLLIGIAICIMALIPVTIWIFAH